MSQKRKILGVVGSYRKGGVNDLLVSETLSAAEEHGADTEKIYLLDQHIEFCRNCRQCTQQPGVKRGRCVQNDDMDDILTRCENSDAIVLGAPVNFFNVNAITRRFMERLVCFAYWPWGAHGPQMRTKAKTKEAVLITSSAMPAFLGRFFTGAPRALKILAKTMGARPVASIFVGLAAESQQASPSKKSIRRARRAGRKLAVS